MSDRFFNRDLSLLEFNRRVLKQATDEGNPLLERLKFLSIFTTNMDELFMKRVGRLKRIIASGKHKTGLDGSPLDLILGKIRRTAIELYTTRDLTYKETLLPALRDAGIQIVTWADLDSARQQLLTDFFHSEVFSVLTPLAVDPAHPFPFLSNLSLSLGVSLHAPDQTEQLFARVKIPDVLPQWVAVQGGHAGVHQFIRLSDVIQEHLHELFREMIIEAVMPFRVIRSASIDVLDEEMEEAEDVVELVEEQLRKRRLAPVVRLDHDATANRWMLDLLQEELELEPTDLYLHPEELNFQNLSAISDLSLPKLRYRKWTPLVPPRFAESGTDIFTEIQKEDILVHHPFDSFTATVERFVEAAVEDPRVLALKMTLYRTSEDSPFIPMLIHAAEKGKQVVCVVEVQARFDEARNLIWAEKLENAGVHVLYGVVGLKTHTKMALVVRKEASQFRLYAHLGTGNYNPQTAKLYTDIGLFTCDSALTADVAEVFNYLTGLSLKRHYDQLLISPINMANRFLEAIETEIGNYQSGKPAHIIAKMNSLEDKAIIEKLYHASQEGVPIDLIVRGLCCLRPQVTGLSETIRVISVVGRFLEHSRIFYFQDGAPQPGGGRIYFGSADWMTRNLHNRVESTVPVLRPRLKERCWEILQLALNDYSLAWELRSDGGYAQRTPSGDHNASGSHDLLMQLTEQRHSTPKTRPTLEAT